MPGPSLEERLIPFNGVLTLLDPHEHDLPTPLADAGYRTLRIGVKVATEKGPTEIDVLAGTADRTALLALECKGGASVSNRQGQRYAALAWDDIVRDAGLDVPDGVSGGRVDVMYVAHEGNGPTVQARIEDKSSVPDFPVIEIGKRHVRLLSQPKNKNLVFEDCDVTMAWPRWMTVDAEADIEDYLDALAAEVIGLMRGARGEADGSHVMAFDHLYRSLVPAYDHLEPVARRTVSRKINVAARALEHEAPRFFMVTVTETGQSGLAILKTPEDLKLQGRTQQWQSLKRLLEDVEADEDPQQSLFIGGEEE